MNKNNVRKGIIIGITISSLVLVGFLGSYAFFQTNGINNNKEEVTINTGTLSLIFSDGNPGINESLEFGKSVTKTFTIENDGTLNAVANMNFDKLINTYTYGSLTYTLEYSESEEGIYKEIVTDRKIFTSEEQSTQVLASNLEIPSKQTYYYKLTITLNNLEDIDQTNDLNAILSTNFILGDGTKNVVEKIKMNAHPLSEQPNFNNIATTDEGIYQMEDDYGTSYYFRGAVENNYVKFAGFYWRIVRVNGDGTLRIIYDGTSAHANGEANADRVATTAIWNDYFNDNKYIGYMYGGIPGETSTSKENAQSNDNDTTIKKELDKWYETNILNTGYHQYMSDVIFCNNRETAEVPGLSYNNLGYGANSTSYKGYYNNLQSNSVSPDIKCSNKNDSFTVTDTNKGNGDLIYPIALITADELTIAGGRYNSNNKTFYLYKGSSYWTMTPTEFTRNKINVMLLYSTGSIRGMAVFGTNYNVLTTKLGLAPVINLSLEAIENLVGSGTMTDPYQLPNK